MKTIKEWVLDQYEMDEIKDITKHGLVGGFSGLTYYTETIAFHDEYETEIWDMLYTDAQDQGLTVMELIASFNGQKDVVSIYQFKNLLTWYAVERVCNEIVNEAEEG
jgi:hypothetical protein